MGKCNIKLPAMEEGFNLWTLGLPFRGYHGMDEVNEKLQLQAFMVHGCYGDEDEIDLGYDTSEIPGGCLHFRNERQSGYSAPNIGCRLTRTKGANQLAVIAAAGSEDTNWMFHEWRGLANGDDHNRNFLLGA